jgi:orotate phosphoribosyltransferase
MPTKFQSEYMWQAHDNPAKILRRARRVLQDVDYDTMIGTGLSGALVVPYLARKLGKSWAIARKDTDNSHASWPIEGAVGERWIFVDDFISSGASQHRRRG